MSSTAASRVKRRREDAKPAKVDASKTMSLLDEELQRATAGTEEAAINAVTKANWDLKRELAPKLAKLERRTQRAIVEIVREKLEAEKEEGSSSREEGSSDEEEEEGRSRAAAADD